MLSVGLLAKINNNNNNNKMEMSCTGIKEAMGSTPLYLKLEFFKLSFHNCQSCIYNCSDLSFNKVHFYRYNSITSD